MIDLASLGWGLVLFAAVDVFGGQAARFIGRLRERRTARGQLLGVLARQAERLAARKGPYR
ncbi:MAG TPA: hypothetical protein VGI39_04865 [Polyangiaceae bacterium]